MRSVRVNSLWLYPGVMYFEIGPLLLSISTMIERTANDTMHSSALSILLFNNPFCRRRMPYSTRTINAGKIQAVSLDPTAIQEVSAAQEYQNSFSLRTDVDLAWRYPIRESAVKRAAKLVIRCTIYVTA